MKNLFMFEDACMDNSSIPLHPKQPSKKRKPGYRTADLVLNKQDILSTLRFTDDAIPIPVVEKVDSVLLPTIALPFSKVINKAAADVLVVFYEPDVNFARILHNPKRYVSCLKKFPYVVGPDFSQKIGMNPFVCFSNSWWNKALTAYFQSLGIAMIPNATWSTPASYEYAFKGIPQRSVIAINSNGIKGNAAALYLWRKGYEEALRVLDPILIIRYGDKLPGEREDISVYYENINQKNLRNGSKRVAC
ncbi:MAG: DUF4417 domain-containing protein [Alloprevotella sp.]|nr:DUF4417 domain-containing protein [Alloprevotella sp.]